MSVLLETMAQPGLVNAAGYLLFFGGIALTVGWIARFMR